MSPPPSGKQRRRELKGRLKSTKNRDLVENTGDNGNNWDTMGNGDNEVWGDTQGEKTTRTSESGTRTSVPNRQARTTANQERQQAK